MKFTVAVAFVLASQECLGSSLNLDFLKAENRKKLVQNIEDKFEIYWYSLVNNGWCPSEAGCRENNYRRIMKEIRNNKLGLRGKTKEVKNAVDSFFNTDINPVDEFKRLGVTKEQGLKLMDHYGVFIVSDLTCGGKNKKCKPETLNTLKNYSKTLERYYGYNGRNLELSDEERLMRYVKVRLIANQGFAEVDKTLKRWKKWLLDHDHKEKNKYNQQIYAGFNYLISSFSDIGDATDDVLEANGDLNVDQKQATYNNLKNDIASNFVDLCNGLQYDAIKCKDFHDQG